MNGIPNVGVQNFEPLLQVMLCKWYVWGRRRVVWYTQSKPASNFWFSLATMNRRSPQKVPNREFCNNPRIFVKCHLNPCLVFLYSFSAPAFPNLTDNQMQYFNAFSFSALKQQISRRPILRLPIFAFFLLAPAAIAAAPQNAGVTLSLIHIWRCRRRD